MFDSDFDESDACSYNDHEFGRSSSYDSFHNAANGSYDSLPLTDYASDVSPLNYYDNSDNFGYTSSTQFSEQRNRVLDYPRSHTTSNLNRVANHPIGRHSSSKSRYKFDQKKRRFHKYEIELESSPRSAEYYPYYRHNKSRHPYRSEGHSNRKPKPPPKPVSSTSLAQDERRTLHNIQEQNRRLAIKRLLKRMQTMYPEHLKCDILGDTYSAGQDLTNPQTMRCLERYVKIIADYYDEYEYLKEEVKRLKKLLSSQDPAKKKEKK